MEIIYIGLSIVQAVAIALGVGSSTLAIVSFFVAIADGKIEPDERKMLGVIYILLRIAMVLIVVTTAILGLIQIKTGAEAYSTPFIISRWILIAILFLNAVLMTKHIMPSKFGPSIQAASWYTLGVTMTLVPLNLAQYSVTEFFMGYSVAIIVAIALVNGIMAHLKKHR